MHCCGSVTFCWFIDPDPEPAFYASGWQDGNKTWVFISNFFVYTSVFKDKKSKRSKIVKSRFFFLFLHIDGFYGMLISMCCLFYGWEVVGVGERITICPPPQPPAVGGEGDNYAFSLLFSLFAFIFFAVWSVSLACEQSEKNHCFSLQIENKNPHIFAYFRFKRIWAAHPNYESAWKFSNKVSFEKSNLDFIT